MTIDRSRKIYSRDLTIVDRQKIPSVRSVPFAYPAIAYRVKIQKYINPDNIFETTVLKLKKCGLNRAEIARKLCLEREVVDDIIEYYKPSDEDADATIHLHREIEEKYYYIFLNTYTNEFLNNVSETDSFDDCTRGHIDDIEGTELTVSTSPGKPVMRVSFLMSEEATLLKEPVAEDIAEIILQKKHVKPHEYVTAQYLNVAIPVYLISEAFYAEKNISDIQVAEPVRGKSISYNERLMLRQILEHNPEANNELIQKLNGMESSARTIQEDVTSLNELITDQIVSEYGKAFRKNYKEAFDTLVEMRKAYLSVQYDKKYIRSVLTQNYHLTEILLETAMSNYGTDDSVFDSISESADVVCQEVLAIARNIGFEIRDPAYARDQFKVTKNKLNSVYHRYVIDTEKGLVKQYDRINVLLAVNLILASKNRDHPLNEIAGMYPQYVDLVFMSKQLGDMGNHTYGEASDDLVIDVYSMACNTISVYLDLGNEGNDIENEHEESAAVSVTPMVGQNTTLYRQYAAEELKIAGLDIIQDECPLSLIELNENYFEKQGNVFSSAYNALVALIANLINKLNAREKTKSWQYIKQRVDDDIRKDPVGINQKVGEIVKDNGGAYFFTVPPRLSSVFRPKHRMDKNSLKLQVYYFILIDDHLSSGMLKTVLARMPDLLETIDYVYSMRGHRSINTFENDEQDQEIYQLVKKINNYFFIEAKEI